MSERRILILGGTRFTGRLLVERLQHQPGLSLTLFHRGRSGPGLFPQLTQLIGDRDSDDITAVFGQDWDCVIDFSGYYPRPVARLAEALDGRCGRYVYISSVSAYDLRQAEFGVPVTESHPLHSWTREDEVDTSMNSYGPRKAAAEAAVLAHPGLNPVVLRPGSIYGPYDATERLYAWIWRHLKREQMLVPEVRGKRLRMTYGPDFAAIVAAAALGPRPPQRVYQVLTHPELSFGELLASIGSVIGRSPNLVPISDADMTARDLKYWWDFPLCLPYERRFDTRAIEQDFSPEWTPFAQSLAETAAYYRALNWPQPKAGLSAAREDQLLAERASGQESA